MSVLHDWPIDYSLDLEFQKKNKPSVGDAKKYFKRCTNCTRDRQQARCGDLDKESCINSERTFYELNSEKILEKKTELVPNPNCEFVPKEDYTDEHGVEWRRPDKCNTRPCNNCDIYPPIAIKSGSKVSPEDAEWYKNTFNNRTRFDPFPTGGVGRDFYPGVYRMEPPCKLSDREIFELENTPYREYDKRQAYADITWLTKLLHLLQQNDCCGAGRAHCERIRAFIKKKRDQIVEITKVYGRTEPTHMAPGVTIDDLRAGPRPDYSDLDSSSRYMSSQLH